VIPVEQLPAARRMSLARRNAARHQLVDVVNAEPKRWRPRWRSPGFAIALGFTVAVGGGAAASSIYLTKGPIPSSPKGGLDFAKAPDFIAVAGRGATAGQSASFRPIRRWRCPGLRGRSHYPHRPPLPWYRVREDWQVTRIGSVHDRNRLERCDNGDGSVLVHSGGASQRGWHGDPDRGGGDLESRIQRQCDLCPLVNGPRWLHHFNLATTYYKGSREDYRDRDELVWTLGLMLSPTRWLRRQSHI
jgi:hypothetical protein